ncbi:hypothetical protein SUGI_1082250 [Cryptomeria japonica]|uniref:uncharacterized protein LOC131032248 n=1 Tax=Cryptomeria japonica TaxID=3369 RepID=UPI0024148153|nr:uncharacterized protein LOC131032248 [Cryptomeria japonica]GLJ50816.1 hypothetical protein SUGI_1082250 [Cryptomeria japonica]
MKSGVIKRKKVRKFAYHGEEIRKKLAKSFTRFHGKQRSLAHFGHYEFSCSSRNRHNFYEDLTQYHHSFHADAVEDVHRNDSDVNNFMSVEEEKIEENDVDRKAEVFIARFHEQLRLQRQRALSKYEGMLARGAD